MSKIDMNQFNDTLFDAIVRKQSIQTLVSRAYACIGLPIISFDVSFKLLAYAFSRPFSFDKWECIAAVGQLTADIIDRDGSLAYQEMMYSSGKSQVFDWGTTEEYPQVCGPIMRDGSLLGYVGIGIESHKTIDDLLEANDLLAAAISISLKNADQTANHTVSQFHAVEGLLLLDSISEGTAQQIAAVCPPPYVFAILASDNPKVSTLQYVRRTLFSNENSALASLSKELYLYILFYDVGQSITMPRIEALLSGIDAKYTFSGSISDYFFHALDIPAYRTQALLAMSVGKEQTAGKGICSFRDYYSDIVCYGALESAGADVCMLSAVQTLVEIDQKENANYLKTLKTYLSCFHNCTLTAEKLGMHKNTILYRIHKIEELIGTDLSDSACVSTLELGLEIYETAKNIREMEAR